MLLFQNKKKNDFFKFTYNLYASSLISNLEEFFFKFLYQALDRQLDKNEKETVFFIIELIHPF